MNPVSVPVDERLASAHNRSRLFWLIAEGLLNGLTTESWSAVKNGASRKACGGNDLLESAWSNLFDVMENAGTESDSRLAVEHTRLFSGLAEGAGPPPPFESVWRNSQEPGDIALSVTQAYAEAGFADIDLDAGPQDHLAVEFKFIALLALREAEARNEGIMVAAEARVRQQRDFLDHHLLQWVPRWIDGVAQETQEPVYWAFVGLISTGLASIVEDLGNWKQADRIIL